MAWRPLWLAALRLAFAVNGENSDTES